MDSKMQTGLLLVLGTIVMFVGWMAVYPADPADDVAAQTGALMGNADQAQAGIILGFGGFIAVIIGLVAVSRRMAMAGGAGSSYAGITAALGTALVALALLGAGLELGVTEATSAAGGATLMGVSMALNGIIPLAMGVALILLGIGIALDKNFNIIVAALAVIVGVVMIVAAFIDAEVLDIVSWIGLGVTTIVLGVFRLRAAE